MTKRYPAVTVIGAGLAGSECAWQLAERGVPVTLIEQKPLSRTPAQHTDYFAELVCSNSFRGTALTNAVGLLKEEMRRSGSLIMRVAEQASVPAGGALAVDRDVFSAEVTRLVSNHERIEVIAREVTHIPSERPVVISTGPLTGDALARDIANAIGVEHLAYYDAIAPIVASDSIDWSRVFKASRYDRGGDDAYVNCPMDETQYHAFIHAMLEAEKVQPKEFEEVRYFEGCLPVEIMAERGPMTLAYGPMKPVGLSDPRTGRRPFAVVQLRQENADASAYNLVGFQTRMTYPEQKRVLTLIPGLENAEFLRLGSVHRNTFIRAPDMLNADLSLRALDGVYLAGQITGVEGYIESAACGLVLGILLAARQRGSSLVPPPPSTALGALLSHLRKPVDDFQPSNVLWSMFPPLDNAKLRKAARHQQMSERALAALNDWLGSIGQHTARAASLEQSASPASAGE
jgi:methylenetetrahydrofolate--tRNA-(uracil-5-)-methyltransferase